MPSSIPSDVHDRLSEMHALRHDVRSRLHLAGMEEILEWQELEPATVAIELEPYTPHLARRLDEIIARLIHLRAAIVSDLLESRTVFIEAVTPLDPDGCEDRSTSLEWEI
ncbi:hypothetical protein LVJ94_05540 [Pendulispora rubella]|uniref:Uncharacterized protein n=1 Tax=Pendulispora rubella TaxID=2741070 RepID=A0ABZ2L7E9_9BACT